MSRDQGTLWYSGAKRTNNFMESLADTNKHYEGDFHYRTDFEDLEFLQFVEGVVFVGPQTSKANSDQAVFATYQGYFDFMRKVHREGKYIAAVIRPDMTIPGKEDYIDKVINADRGRTITSIANDISGFFNLIRRKRV